MMMNSKFQRRVQRYGWSKAAPYYENAWQSQLRPAQDRLLEMADLARGERALDVACGTGLVTSRVASQVTTDGHVSAVDLSEGMLEQAKVAAEERNLQHVSFHQMDAEALDFPDAHFDVALCSLGLMYAPAPERALREMCRVLTPGGRAVAAVWGRRDRCGWAGIFPVVDARVESEVCPLFFRLGTGDTLSRAFRDVGFSDVTADRFATTLHYPDEETALEAAFDAGAVSLAYRRFDDETKASAHADYLDTIAPYQNDTGYEIPGEFVVVRGSRPES